MDGLVAAVKAEHATQLGLREERLRLQTAVVDKNSSVHQLYQRQGSRHSKYPRSASPLSDYSPKKFNLLKNSRSELHVPNYSRHTSPLKQENKKYRSRRPESLATSRSSRDGNARCSRRRFADCPIDHIPGEGTMRRSDQNDLRSYSGLPRYSAGDAGLTASSGSLFSRSRLRSSSTQTEVDSMSEGPLSAADEHSLRFAAGRADAAGKWSISPRPFLASQVNPDAPRMWTRSHWHRNKYTRRWLWVILGVLLVGCGVVGGLWWFGLMPRWVYTYTNRVTDKCSYCWLFRDKGLK
ncbi:uncharacterized protein LOC129590506 isoform X2 [Paramacrobiotus metropolitanus]|nr:uncharacterized protein LOC129590506 isoform X2 [Paramacrobiotus metropolitanus]